MPALMTMQVFLCIMLGTSSYFLSASSAMKVNSFNCSSNAEIRSSSATVRFSSTLQPLGAIGRKKKKKNRLLEVVKIPPDICARLQRPLLQFSESSVVIPQYDYHQLLDAIARLDENCKNAK